MRNRVLTVLILVLVASSANAQSPKYENPDSAVSLLSSYYDAVNRKDYRGHSVIGRRLPKATKTVPEVIRTLKKCG